tara:strand:- start:4202 stop:4411 length:210 start_codon:yes stop_codon:yes gene_type:complete
MGYILLSPTKQKQRKNKMQNMNIEDYVDTVLELNKNPEKNKHALKDIGGKWIIDIQIFCAKHNIDSKMK